MKPRNGHACAPIMRKGGPHQASNSAKRAQQKRQLHKTVREYKATDGRLDHFWALVNA